MQDICSNSFAQPNWLVRDKLARDQLARFKLARLKLACSCLLRLQCKGEERRSYVLVWPVLSCPVCLVRLLCSALPGLSGLLCNLVEKDSSL